LGEQALYSTSTGGNNIAMGRRAGYSNQNGVRNVFLGYHAGYTGTSHDDCVFIGSNAGDVNTADDNIGIGTDALGANTTGTQNVAIGYQAGDAVTTGNSNTFIGRTAGGQTTTGGSNTFIGEGSGNANITGTDNTFLGQDSGSLITGSKNTILGCFNGNQNGLNIATSSNNIVLSDGDGNVRAHCDSSGNWTGIGGGGITVADQFRLTSSFTGDAVPLSSNLSRVSGTGAGGGIGSAMSVSSGVFTFPETGVYLVSFNIRANNSADSGFLEGKIRVTTNNSTYSDIATCRTSGGTGSEDSAGCSILLDVTSTSNTKVKFDIEQSNNSNSIQGNANANLTYMTFIRLGDT